MNANSVQNYWLSLALIARHIGVIVRRGCDESQLTQFR